MQRTTNQFRTHEEFEIEKIEMGTIVRFDDRSNYFDFYSDGRMIYSIELDRITEDTIIRWVNHLCGKIWVNREHILQFLQLASNHANISIHGSL